MSKKQKPKIKKEQPKTVQEKRFSLVVIGLVMLIAGFIVYSNTLHAPFEFDDYGVIVNNKEVRTYAITSHVNQQRYIGYLSFAVNYFYGELNPFGYHVVNVIIHVLNGILIYILVQKVLLILQSQGRAFFRRDIPLIAALLFVVHPIQTQAVSYITQRFAVLAALFVLISLVTYLHFRSLPSKSYTYLIISLIACLLAYKTKENVATLPFMIIAAELLLFRDQKITKERIFYVVPYFLLIIVIPLSFMHMNQPLGELLGEMKKVSYETPHTSRGEYFFTELRVITTYMRLLILPVRQSIDYVYPLSKSLFEVKTAIAFCFIGAVLVFAFLLHKKYPVITFGMLWFFIFLIVESSIIPIQDVIFEHRLYLPSAGFLIAAVYAVFLLEEKIKMRLVVPVIFLMIIIALSITAYTRNNLWNDSIALWDDAAKKFPGNARAVGNMGISMADKGKFGEAIPVLKQAIELMPNNTNNWYALGACYKKLGMTEDAIRTYQKTLELNPRYQKASYDLADVYMQRREFQNAYPVLMKSKEADDKHPYTNSLLALYYCETGDISRAIALMDEADRNGLDLSNGYFNFAICLINHSQMQQARRFLFRTVELNKNEIDSYHFIAVTYDTERDVEKAAYYYKKFLSLTEDSQWVPEARQRLQQIEKQQ